MRFIDFDRTMLYVPYRTRRRLAALARWVGTVTLLVGLAYVGARSSQWMQIHYPAWAERLGLGHDFPQEVVRWRNFYAQLLPDRRVALIRVELPRQALSSLRALGKNRRLAAIAVGERAPFVAVPRRFASALDHRGVPYLDPRHLPRESLAHLSEGLQAMCRAHYVLVPDFSILGVSQFAFARTR